MQYELLYSLRIHAPFSCYPVRRVMICVYQSRTESSNGTFTVIKLGRFFGNPLISAHDLGHHARSVAISIVWLELFCGIHAIKPSFLRTCEFGPFLLKSLGFVASGYSVTELTKTLGEVAKMVLNWGKYNTIKYDIAKMEAVLFSKLYRQD